MKSCFAKPSMDGIPQSSALVISSPKKAMYVVQCPFRTCSLSSAMNWLCHKLASTNILSLKCLPNLFDLTVLLRLSLSGWLLKKSPTLINRFNFGPLDCRTDGRCLDWIIIKCCNPPYKIAQLAGRHNIAAAAAATRPSWWRNKQ